MKLQDLNFSDIIFADGTYVVDTLTPIQYLQLIPTVQVEDYEKFSKAYNLKKNYSPIDDHKSSLAYLQDQCSSFIDEEIRYSLDRAMKVLNSVMNIDYQVDLFHNIDGLLESYYHSSQIHICNEIYNFKVAETQINVSKSAIVKIYYKLQCKELREILLLNSLSRQVLKCPVYISDQYGIVYCNESTLNLLVNQLRQFGKTVTTRAYFENKSSSEVVRFVIPSYTMVRESLEGLRMFTCEILKDIEKVFGVK